MFIFTLLCGVYLKRSSEGIKDFHKTIKGPTKKCENKILK